MQPFVSKFGHGGRFAVYYLKLSQSK